MEQHISQVLGLSKSQVSAVLNLLNDGGTIPFIARYRKEQTRGLDEVEIEKIDNERKKWLELEKRKAVVLVRLAELKISNEALINRIQNCTDSRELEDLYLPYKPTRKTKAAKARERGLEPLAKIIVSQRQNDIMAQAYRFARNGMTADDALEGARHIIAEWMSVHENTRNQLRRSYTDYSSLVAKVDKKKKDEASKYQDYFDFRQSLKRVPSHRVLAIFRAEKEGLLKVHIEIDTDYALGRIEKQFIRSSGEAAHHLKLAAKDALKRLLMPSLETEARNDAKEKADAEAIGMFATNLNQLLLAPPLGAKAILAIDPGFKSGCKVVCLDARSNLKRHTVIYPHPPQNKRDNAKGTIQNLVKTYEIKAIAIGNGTAGRETEQFIHKILPPNHDIEVYLISEAGASIYSASEAGRMEFPDLDLTVRGAVSIGRRLADPLAELVKIDPKSIGVGQYQHDVAQDKLKNSLDNTVSFAVNKVGVNLNTASKHLLRYVAGVGPKLADNIIHYRSANGAFKSRKELLKVKGFGGKSFEQAAGFLQVKNGENPLDASGVHPERYTLVESIADSLQCDVEELIGNADRLSGLDASQFVNDEVGLPTLTDILAELNKPGLDPRGAAKPVVFDDSIRTIEDVKVGMKLFGKVTNLTKFGAFVDIGIKENGLVHISQIADRRISDPSEVLSLDQQVEARVMDVDLARKRIGLSLRLD